MGLVTGTVARPIRAQPGSLCQRPADHADVTSTRRTGEPSSGGAPMASATTGGAWGLVGSQGWSGSCWRVVDPSVAATTARRVRQTRRRCMSGETTVAEPTNQEFRNSRAIMHRRRDLASCDRSTPLPASRRPRSSSAGSTPPGARASQDCPRASTCGGATSGRGVCDRPRLM